LCCTTDLAHEVNHCTYRKATKKDIELNGQAGTKEIQVSHSKGIASSIEVDSGKTDLET
jgi:hypothetical protein